MASIGNIAGAAQLDESGSLCGSQSVRNNARPIDLVHLSTYTLGDRSLEGELLGLFRYQAGLYLGRLEAARSDKEWKDATHSIKGSARTLGALNLADLAATAEAGLIEGQDMFRHRMVSAIAAEIEAVNLYIETLTSSI